MSIDKAGEVLKGFFAFYGLEKGEKYVSFFSRWREMVGDDLASHSRVADVRRGAAVVEVDHPGWMQLLQMREEEILKKIKTNFPELGIRSLHMRIVPEGRLAEAKPVEQRQTKGGPIVPPDSAPRPVRGPAETPAKKPLEVEALSPKSSPLEGIRDPKLQEILGRLKKSIGE